MRFSSIDVLRTLSIFVMVVVHFTENLSGYTPQIAGIGAPMFMFLSGVSYRLWLNGRSTRDLPSTTVTKITVRRGLFLFTLGFFFNIFVWLPEEVYNWDVLTLIGVGLMTLALVRKATLGLILLACGLLFVLSPVLQHIAGWETYWTDDYFDPDLTLSDVILGFLVVGYFPIFPWLLFPLLGYTTGSLIFGTSGKAVNLTALRNTAAIGLCLMFAAGIAVGFRWCFPDLFPPTWPKSWTMFPPSVEYLVGTTGWTMFAFGFCYWLLDCRWGSETLVGLRTLAERFSRRSLTAYLLHHVVHLWPLWLYAMWRGQEPTYYWRQATEVWVALALAGVFLVFCCLFFAWLDRTGRPTVENLMRWLCD